MTDEKRPEGFVDDAGIRICDMWWRFAQQCENAATDCLIADMTPERGAVWAKHAEAAYWKATGEADSHDFMSGPADRNWPPYNDPTPTDE